MSIEVRVNASISPLWTCIKVLIEHIVCTEHSTSILNLSFLLSFSLCLSLTLSLYVSPLFLCVFCFYSPEPVVFCFNFRTLSFTPLTCHNIRCVH